MFLIFIYIYIQLSLLVSNLKLGGGRTKIAVCEISGRNFGKMRTHVLKSPPFPYLSKGFWRFFGLQNGAGYDSWSGRWDFSWFYSGVCQPIGIGFLEFTKGIRTKILLEGMAEPFGYGKLSTMLTHHFFLNSFLASKKINIHREFLWNWGIGRTHCWWLSAALNEQRP